MQGLEHKTELGQELGQEQGQEKGRMMRLVVVEEEQACSWILEGQPRRWRQRWRGQGSIENTTFKDNEAYWDHLPHS